MMDDSHEWVMWQVSQTVPLSTTRATIYSAGRDYLVLERRSGNALALHSEKRTVAWAVRVQKKVNAWVKGADDKRLSALLGYQRDDLVDHLERQFTRGMSWSNYAGHCRFKEQKAWVIEHIVPKMRFAESEVEAAFALTNLRPLWINANLAKSIRRTHLI